MRLHQLKPAEGAHRNRKRLGRGNASGQGTTAGKGTKGEKARSGGLKAGFRGMSSRNARMAKRRGFTNIFKVEYQIVSLHALNQFPGGAEVNPMALQEAGLIGNAARPVKILANGDITVPVNVSGLKLSAAAREKIEMAGGLVTVEAPLVEVDAPLVGVDASLVEVGAAEGAAADRGDTQALTRGVPDSPDRREP